VNFLDGFSKNTKDIKIHENPSSGIRVVPCGQTDRNDIAGSRLSLFCDPAWSCRSRFLDPVLIWLEDLRVCTVHQWRLKHFIIQQMHKFII